MNLKTRPLLIAVSAGGLLNLVAFVVQAFFAFVFYKLIVEIETQNSFDVSLKSVLLMALLWLGTCLGNIGLDSLTGAIYAWLSAREESLTPSDGLVGGGTASAFARLGGGILGLVISLLLFTSIFRRFGVGDPGEDPLFLMYLTQPMSNGMIGLVSAVVLAALFGAVGGVIIALIRERRSGQLAGAGLL